MEEVLLIHGREFHFGEFRDKIEQLIDDIVIVAKMRSDIRLEEHKPRNEHYPQVYGYTLRFKCYQNSEVRWHGVGFDFYFESDVMIMRCGVTYDKFGYYVENAKIENLDTVSWGRRTLDDENPYPCEFETTNYKSMLDCLEKIKELAYMGSWEDV